MFASRRPGPDASHEGWDCWAARRVRVCCSGEGLDGPPRGRAGPHGRRLGGPAPFRGGGVSGAASAAGSSVSCTVFAEHRLRRRQLTARAGSGAPSCLLVGGRWPRATPLRGTATSRTEQPRRGHTVCPGTCGSLLGKELGDSKAPSPPAHSLVSPQGRSPEEPRWRNPHPPPRSRARAPHGNRRQMPLRQELL